MYSAKTLDHFRRPRNRGAIEGPCISVEVTNPVCGDKLTLWVLVERSRVAQVGFECEGCIPAVACASLLTETIMDKSISEIQNITVQTLESALGGLPPASRHASTLAISGLEQVREILRSS